MLYADKLINEPFMKYQIMKYLEDKLDRAGLANIDIQPTPVVTRITLEVINPARIIGKRGRLINELTETIRKEFKIENPQISVVEVKNFYLEPKIVAKRAARHIETGKKVRAVLHFFLREILRAGALGAEIVASGTVSKGGRAKTLRVSAGYIPKAGEITRLIRKARFNAVTRFGVIGILVRLVPPGTEFPDKKIEAISIPKVVSAAETIDGETTAVSPNTPQQEPAKTQG